MEETKTQAAEPSPDTTDRSSKPIIHRVCEACNNMFATRAGEKEQRCPNCRKE